MCPLPPNRLFNVANHQTTPVEISTVYVYFILKKNDNSFFHKSFLNFGTHLHIFIANQMQSLFCFPPHFKAPRGRNNSKFLDFIELIHIL